MVSHVTVAGMWRMKGQGVTCNGFWGWRAKGNGVTCNGLWHCCLRCFGLHCFALRCIVLLCFALFCIALLCIALHCFALLSFTLRCISNCLTTKNAKAIFGIWGFWARNRAQEAQGTLPGNPGPKEPGRGTRGRETFLKAKQRRQPRDTMPHRAAGRHVDPRQLGQPGLPENSAWEHSKNPLGKPNWGKTPLQTLKHAAFLMFLAGTFGGLHPFQKIDIE